MQESLPTLDEVQLHFEHWRHTRHNLREAIPQSLWSEVALLRGRYADRQIAQQLRLNCSQLRSRTNSQISSTSHPTFVELALPPEKSNAPLVELIHPSGMTLKFTSINADQLSNMIVTFMKHT